MDKRSRLLPLIVSMMLASPAAGAESVDLEPVRDNTIYQASGGLLSNGVGDYIFTGNSAVSYAHRALIDFDASATIPAGSDIISATLILNMSRTMAGPVTVSMHRLNSDWGEGASDADGNEGSGAAPVIGDATWLHSFFDTSFWSTPGGDFSPTVSASAVVDGLGEYSWSSEQLADDVQDMLENPASDHGWILLGGETGPTTSKRFDSRENASGGPVLRIEYSENVPGESTAWGGIKALFR